MQPLLVQRLKPEKEVVAGNARLMEVMLLLHAAQHR